MADASVTIDALVSAALGVDVGASRTVGGGDVASSHRLDLADGRTVFAKTHSNPPPNFFSTEAAGLAWLRSSDTVAVPELLHVSDSPPLLVLEWIEEGGRPDEAEFGRALAGLHSAGLHSAGLHSAGLHSAGLHSAGLPTFGRPDGRTTGSLALPNDPADSWAEFLAERRLLHLVRIANDRGSLSAEAIRRVEELAGRLDDVVPPPESPHLLHGDLWSGNRMVDARGRSWLIDPACFGGHREFDLAMMQLFGGYGALVFEAYHEAFPLADGWRGRVALHQLPPLIVHAIKFGGSYVAAVDRALDQY